MAKSSGFPETCSPRKAMAMNKISNVSEPGDNFGVSSTLGGGKPLSNVNRGMSHKPMSEAKRNPPLKGGAKKANNQRHPDHGPQHNY